MNLCFLERLNAEEVKKCWSENLQQELTAHQSVWNCRHPRRLGWLELITLVSNDNLPMSSSTTTLCTTEVEGFTSFPSILRTTDSKSLWWWFGELLFNDYFLHCKIHIFQSHGLTTGLQCNVEKQMYESRVRVLIILMVLRYKNTYHNICRHQDNSRF